MSTTGVCNMHFPSGLEPALLISTTIRTGANFMPIFCTIAKKLIIKFRSIYIQIMLRITTLKFKEGNVDDTKFWNIWLNEL
jgi:hypothetical protein